MSEIDVGHVAWLTNTQVTDPRFKQKLLLASAASIRAALDRLQQPGEAKKKATLKRRLKFLQGWQQSFDQFKKNMKRQK